MVAYRAKTLFQVIIGSREIWHIITIKEPLGKPVGGRHEVVHSLTQRAVVCFVFLHAIQPLLQVSSDLLRRFLIVIGQDVRNPADILCCFLKWRPYSGSCT